MFICQNGHSRENVKDRCKICKAVNSRKWRNNNKEKIKELAFLYLAKPEKRVQKNLRGKKWREANPEKIRDYWQKFNSSPAAPARCAKRRGKRLNATPSWVDKDAIELQYIKAKFMEWFTGEKYHVDHIIPLQGKNVCGLHVEYNLQVLPATENLQKSNRLEF